MIDNTLIKEAKEKVQNKLFDAIYDLPPTIESKSFPELQNKIQVILIELENQTKINVEEIERVCKTNKKLLILAKLLREHIPPEGMKENNFSFLISSIINMFTLMMTSPKMIDFFNKHNIPFSLFRIILRFYSITSKFEYLKKMEIEFSFKFIAKLLTTNPKTFPRFYGLLMLNILNEYSEKVLKDRKQQGQDLLLNRENDKALETVKIIAKIALDLIKSNLKLACQSGILVVMYKKAIENDLSNVATIQLIEIISHHMNFHETRELILKTLDLCRVFSLFTNVDGRSIYGKAEERLERFERCSMMVEMLLSTCPTLFYFITEKVTLRNFVISLKSKSKTEKELSIINEKVFKKLIDKALRYDRNKMQRSNNNFGLHSNYLNYRALLAMSFFLENTELFEVYLNSDPNGSIFAGLGKISLMYFPRTFEKGKYNKEIIQTIKLPSASDYEKLSKDFLNILSYYDYCIIPYEFSKSELINYFLYIKEMQEYKDEFSEELKENLENLLIRAKHSDNQNFDQLLLDFYIEGMKICEVLPWKPEYLKLCNFFSSIIEYLRPRDYSAIMNACLSVVIRIFTTPKPQYYRYLYITCLDDAGRYFQEQDKVQQLILNHYKSNDYSFRISRILLHSDLNKRETLGLQSHRKILETICCDEGCEELILQSIEIIRFYCIDNDDKADWGSQLICEKLIYHESEEIAAAAVKFCEEFMINHRTHKSNLYKIELSQIKEDRLRKRIMYLLLNNEKGIDILNAYDPEFIKKEIELWLISGPNNIKKLSIFLNEESKKVISFNDENFLDIGKMSDNRHKLIFLPWNICINGKYYVGLASYEYLKEKIKLRVTPHLLVENKTEAVYFEIGGSTENKTKVTIKREEVQKRFDQYEFREKQDKILAIHKGEITFFFKYKANELVLQKLLIDVHLARDVYRSLTYPLNFLTLMTKTGKGFSYLRELNFIQLCIKFCKENLDVELNKGAIESLGVLFACWKLELAEKIDIFTFVLEVFEKTNNSEVREVSLWTLNIIVKDEELRKKLKENKGWLVLESKYCGWLCYPQFYSQNELSEREICQFSHISTLLPEKLNNEGYRLILSVLDNVDRYEKDVLQRNKKKEMVEYFKKPENKEHAWDPKLLERVVLYLSTVNFGLERTREILDMFADYYLSSQFETDFPQGLALP